MSMYIPVKKLKNYLLGDTSDPKVSEEKPSPGKKKSFFDLKWTFEERPDSDSIHISTSDDELFPNKAIVYHFNLRHPDRAQLTSVYFFDKAALGLYITQTYPASDEMYDIFAVLSQKWKTVQESCQHDTIVPFKREDPDAGYLATPLTLVANRIS